MMGSEVVDNHLELCDDLLNLLKEENRLLRNEPGGLTDEFLQHKKEMLPRLDDSLAALRQLHEQSPQVIPAVSEKLESAQKKIMRILLLDKENEQLLLKSMLPGSKKPVTRNQMGSLKGIYEKHKLS